jgi:DMSO/TMAO reductase YedYZ molybdopterin-dependent catalytic subunit
MRRGIIAALIFTVLGGCSKVKADDAVSAATQARYRANEITEYQGARLDPAIGPRDNSIKGVQRVNMTNYRLTISGLVENPREMRYAEVLALTASEKKITLHCVEGWDATVLWKGVRLMELLARAKPEAVTVIFHSVDGYTTSLPLATVKERDLILAYSANGLDLPAELGYPFTLVAEDKLGYKWARWVNKIELSADPNYRGYWEQRGYTNAANVPPQRLLNAR